jgi:hypothetical protein
VFAGIGAVYLWTINLAIVRDADLRRIDELQIELMATREALGQAEGDYGFLNGAILSPLKGSDKAGPSKRASGVVLHRGPKLFVIARALPAAPKGHAWTLWAWFGGKPLRAGDFQCGPDGTLRGRHTMSRDLGTVEGFSLTLEAAGGAPAPAGPVYLTRQ